MLKKINRILDIVMGVSIGLFSGHGIYLYWDYKAHPGLYELRSAPWYTGILFYGLFTAVVLITVIVIKLIIRHRLRE